jgi:hypothetical protein
VRESVDRCRLAIARDDEAASTMRQQILCDSVDEPL